jgi:diadenosine tetraphosphate (Ap4A) HIT family hydrolase
MSTCPFCARIASGVDTVTLRTAVAFPDAYPVAAGHMLVVPATHKPSLLEVNANVLQDLWALAIRLASEMQGNGADGVNIGANIGPAAGQTIMHAHLHVIPRATGDVADPRGGVRWVLPERAAYWKPAG